MGKGKEGDGKGEGRKARGGEGGKGKDDLHPTLFLGPADSRNRVQTPAEESHADRTMSTSNSNICIPLSVIRLQLPCNSCVTVASEDQQLPL